MMAERNSDYIEKNLEQDNLKWWTNWSDEKWYRFIIWKWKDKNITELFLIYKIKFSEISTVKPSVSEPNDENKDTFPLSSDN